MIDPLVLTDVSNRGLSLLEFLSRGETIGKNFWEGLHRACRDEMEEREKPAREREISFSVPVLNREDAAIVVNEIRYLAAKLDDCPDDSLVLLITGAGLAVEAQLNNAVLQN